MTEDNDKPEKPTESPEQPHVQVVDFLSLSKGAKELTIEYSGQFYRLRATKNGKLLLNK